MKNISLIAIVGATASGKTEAGVRVAGVIGGEVVCVDSRTVYRGMDIGTAKIEERGKGKEESWGIDLVEPDTTFTVADFVAYATEKIADIVSRGKVPVLVGGTGLYFRALLDGLTLTHIAPNAALRQSLEEKTTEELVTMLREHDSEAAATIDTHNRRRLIRALEIVLTTGEPLSHQQKKVPTPYDVCWIGIDVPRDMLFHRIDARVDKMIEAGLVDEAQGLYQKFGSASQAMSGIGYRQLIEFFEGRISLFDAIAKIKTDTRRYAKRQLTWFTPDARIRWVTSTAEAVNVAKSFIQAPLE